MNLSKAQRAILSKLWEQGTFLHFMTGLNAHYFFSQSMENAHFRTVRKLIALGLLKQGRSDWRGSEWHLSDSGKQEAMKL